MSSNSNLQVSHPLEKPSTACPADFRRGWRETFKVIPHRLLNKPSIHSSCIPVFPPPYRSVPPWTQRERERGLVRRRGGGGVRLPLSLFFLFQQAVAHNYSFINMAISHSVVVERRAEKLNRKVTWLLSNSSNSCEDAHTHTHTHTHTFWLWVITCSSVVLIANTLELQRLWNIFFKFLQFLILLTLYHINVFK